MRTGLGGVVCLLFALCVAVDADAQHSLPAMSPAVETFTILPTLGGQDAFATGVSEAGHVVGWAATEDETPHAFVWTRAAGLRELVSRVHRSAAYGVNDYGQVVGWFENEQGIQRAFVWSERKGVTELPAPAASTSTARFITNTGRILGQIDNEDVVWEPDGTVRPVSAIVGAPVNGVLMNQFGDFVGGSWAGAFRWTARTGFEIFNLPGYTTGINDAGDVVAVGQPDPDVTMQPFLWTAAGARAMLHPPIGGENVAGPVNNVRQAIGWAESDTPDGWDSMAFLWSPATGLVPIWATNGEDGGFLSATAGINDQATMVGMIETDNVTPFSGGRVAVVVQLRTTPAQFTSAMRVRITAAARHGLLAHGHSRALLARLDQIERDLRRRHAGLSHVRDLQRQISALGRTGALPDAFGLPLRILAAKLIDSVR